MKHKTVELEGALLDIAVAVALGMRMSARILKTDEPVYVTSDAPFDCGPSTETGFADSFAPSERWDHGGPIIQREQMVVVPESRLAKEWFAALDGEWGHDIRWYGAWALGPTPLVAAMRAFVKSKLGEEVELP